MTVEMISEVDNITKGRVEATSEYLTSKKVIGIASANIIPGLDGVAPLSKQTTFKKEEPAMQEFVNPTEIMSQVTSEPDPLALNQEIPVEPVQNEVSPVAITDPSTLDKVDAPDIVLPSFETVGSPISEEIMEQPLDIQLPEMTSDIPAQEPTVVDNQLFENIATAELPGTLPSDDASIDAKRQALIEDITNYVNQKVTEYLNELEKNNTVQEQTNIEMNSQETIPFVVPEDNGMSLAA